MKWGDDNGRMEVDPSVTIAGVFLHIYVVFVHAPADILQEKLHSERCLNQSFGSAASILIRDFRAGGVQLDSDLSSTDEPQFSKCLNPDDLQML